MLESKEFDAFGRDIVKRVEELAKKKGVTMAQIATAWVLANDGFIHCDIGGNSSCLRSYRGFELKEANRRSRCGC